MVFFELASPYPVRDNFNLNLSISPQRRGADFNGDFERLSPARNLALFSIDGLGG